jgi:phosphodiesterase/alkaline phosphatase D-like protein
MSDTLSRRQFLHESALAAGAAALVAGAAESAPAAEAASDFASCWEQAHDRIWLGPEYWANPLQDWRIAGGRIECTKSAVNRNVHLLTRDLGEQPGTLQMSVKIGRIGGKLSGDGSAGFRIGIRGPLNEYRNNVIYGQGLDAGFSGEGKLFIGAPAGGVAVDLAGESIELRLVVEPRGEQSNASISAHDAGGKELARAVKEVASSSLAGNLALVANFGAQGTSAGPGVNAAGKAKKKKQAEAAPPSSGQFWFADWKVRGSRVQAHDERAFGPILFNHYTLHWNMEKGGIVKMTAQLPPLGEQDVQTVSLQVEHEFHWIEVGNAKIDPVSRTAAFRVDKWPADRDVKYRLVYQLTAKDGTPSPHIFHGTVRRDPKEQPVLSVADVSCNIHEAFPNVLYTANMAKLNPDLLAFVGDQFYESSGGYGVQRAPLAPAILDYLRKWYLHGWTWRELTRDRPSVSIPDDHDVYQGNNWGEGGAAQTGTQEQGGYNMPGAWVNVVHKTQTAHHPDPWDATPCKQGISVYSGPLVYGGVSFAILADRQFKSGPEGKVPPTGGRGDHVTDPNFDPKTADVPGLQLLGPGQMQHLAAWVREWRGAEMKAVISQTIFTAMATTHSNEGRLVADYDTNGWPQTERNNALREIRKAHAFHIAGDQHLPAIVHYGIDAHRDAGLAFAGPAVNTGYPRWFEPLTPGENRAAGAPDNTGDFRDSFGHPMTVLAVADGAKQPRQPVLERLHDKVSGIGLVRFNKPKRQITIECWPLLADVTAANSQFRGWPQTFDVQANYGRKPAAHLPTLIIASEANPLLEIIDESTGELVWARRLATRTIQPGVFAAGKYTARLGVPESGKSNELRGLEASATNAARLEVSI